MNFKFNYRDQVFIKPLGVYGLISGWNYKTDPQGNDYDPRYHVEHEETVWDLPYGATIPIVIGSRLTKSIFSETDLDPAVHKNTAEYLDIEVASGSALDYLAELCGVKRYPFESDANFRNRIKKSASPVCECGKDKHNFSTHSNWCPKYE